MDAVDGDVSDQDAMHRCQRRIDGFIDLGQAEGNPDEPEAARFAVAPAERCRLADEIGRLRVGYGERQRRDRDRASENAGEPDHGGRQQRSSPHHASPSTT
jgi:hypothetical protein